MTKAFVAPAVHFKGSGWAKKDRGSSARAARAKDEKDGAGGDATAKTRRRVDLGFGRLVRRVGIGVRFENGRRAEGHLLGRLGDDVRVVGLSPPDARRSDRLDHPRRGLARSWRPRTSSFRPATIGHWARTGKLQSIKLGGRRFVRRGEVRALVAAPRRVRAEELQPSLFEELQG